ncbi:hypothetical protein Tco_0005054 [Tanacetum coccineum]
MDVLHNSPEIDTYRAPFQDCERHANNLQDPEVSTTSELFALANGPSRTPMSVNACVVDGVRVKSGSTLATMVESRNYLRNRMTQIIGSSEWWKNDQYILATQVKQVFYLEDPAKPNVKVIEHVNHKKFFNRSVIVVENEPDIIHLDNSSDLPPSTSGNDMDNVTF